MRTLIAFAIALCPVAAVAQTVQPGLWDVTSTVVDLTVPGVPRFLVRMARGQVQGRAQARRGGSGHGRPAGAGPEGGVQRRQPTHR